MIIPIYHILRREYKRMQKKASLLFHFLLSTTLTPPRHTYFCIQTAMNSVEFKYVLPYLCKVFKVLAVKIWFKT